MGILAPWFELCARWRLPFVAVTEEALEDDEYHYCQKRLIWHQLGALDDAFVVRNFCLLAPRLPVCLCQTPCDCCGGRAGKYSAHEPDKWRLPWQTKMCMSCHTAMVGM